MCTRPRSRRNKPAPSRYARALPRPGARGQDEPVAVRICDRDTPAVPVRVAGRHPGATRVDQAADQILINLAAEVEDEQVFLGRRGWRRVLGIADELEMPGGAGPADHQQRMAA